MYSLSMQDLFDLEDVFKRCAELPWLGLLGENDVPGKKKTTTSTYLSPTSATTNSSAGVGYKMSTEKKGTEQSGGMEICISRDLEDAMEERRKSSVDFFGNYEVTEPLPQPCYRHGAMI